MMMDGKIILQRRPLPTKHSNKKSIFEKVKCLSKHKDSSWEDGQQKKINDHKIFNCLKPLGPNPFPPRCPKKNTMQLTKQKLETEDLNQYQILYKLPTNETCVRDDREGNQICDSKVCCDMDIHGGSMVNSTIRVVNLNSVDQLPEILSRKPWRQKIIEKQFYLGHDHSTVEHGNVSSVTVDEILNDSSSICNESTSVVVLPNVEEDHNTHLEMIERFAADQKTSGTKYHIPETIDSALGGSNISSLVLNEDDTKLNLKAHFFEVLPNIPLQLLETLTIVNLSFNDFTEIPKQLFMARHVISINMRNNPVKRISEGLKKLGKMKYLNFAFCCLTDLHESIYTLSALEVVDVSYNYITTVHSDIKYLVSLKELYVEGNFIRVFPTEILKLKLINLNCQGNFLHKLFWKESVPVLLQSLYDIALTCISRSFTRATLSSDLKQRLDNGRYSPCFNCNNVKPCQGVPVVKPVAEIFGVRNVPILFHVCSQTCKKQLLASTRLSGIS